MDSGFVHMERVVEEDCGWSFFIESRHGRSKMGGSGYPKTHSASALAHALVAQLDVTQSRDLWTWSVMTVVLYAPCPTPSGSNIHAVV